MRLSLKANITPDEAHILDTILHAAGFANRTDYLTALILAPPLYAWTDRWLDRTHNTTAHEDRDSHPGLFFLKDTRGSTFAGHPAERI